MTRSLLAATLAFTFLAAAPLCLGADAKPAATQKTEEPEVKVKLADCPKVVQDTLKKEAGTAVIGNVDKETEDGKTTYEVDVTIDGKNWEIKVAEDGTLISKKIDDEKDEDKKDEKDGKDQKGEHKDI